MGDAAEENSEGLLDLDGGGFGFLAILGGQLGEVFLDVLLEVVAVDLGKAEHEPAGPFDTVYGDSHAGEESQAILVHSAQMALFGRKLEPFDRLGEAGFVDGGKDEGPQVGLGDRVSLFSGFLRPGYRLLFVLRDTQPIPVAHAEPEL